MRPLGEAIAQQFGFYVYAPLLPGHGGPPHLMHGLSVEDFMQSAREALAKVRAQHSTVIVCAYSMGGAIAASLIADDPPAAFVGIAPMFSIRMPLMSLAPLARYVLPWIYPLKLASIDRLGLRAELLSYDPALNLDDPATIARLRNEVGFPVTIADELRKMANQARKAARRIHTPTLIIQGSADLLINPAGAQRFYDTLPATDKQLHLLPGADHVLVKPHSPGHDAMLHLVTDWLAARFS